MHTITIPFPIDMGNLGSFPAGRFIMEDVAAAEIMIQFPDLGITLEPHVPSTALLNHIVVAGGLGMGDAIMLTPVLRALKEKNPQAIIEVACFAHYRAPLLNLPYVDGFVDWPMPESRDHMGIIWLENFPRHALAKTHHMTDVFAAICGVTVTNHTADYRPTQDERDWAVKAFPRIPARRRLGLQVQASQRCRTWPAENLRDLMMILVKDGWEIYLMGGPGEYACQEIGHVHDLRLKAPAFRESAAFLLTCDAFCGPDSGFMHVSGAMNIPSVACFGVIPWRLRTAHYPSVFAIQGAGDCSPCFHTHNRLQPPFPRTGPCATTGRCEVLAGITAERVAAKLNACSATRPPSA